MGAGHVGLPLRCVDTPRLQFVDVTKRFIGHGVNALDPWILGLTDPGLFHPTMSGYRAYAAAVTSAINPRDLR